MHFEFSPRQTKQYNWKKEACEKLSQVTAYAGDFAQIVLPIETKISDMEG